MHAKSALALIPALALLSGAPALAQEQTILPGYWDVTNKVSAIISQTKTEKRCITPAEVAKPSNRGVPPPAEVTPPSRTAAASAARAASKPEATAATKPPAETKPAETTARTPPSKPTSSDPLGDLAAARAGTSTTVTPGAATADPFTYFVQAGAFRTSDDADAQRARLSLMGVEARVTEREQAGRTVYRVRVGPFQNKDAADRVKGRLDGNGFDSALVRVQR